MVKAIVVCIYRDYNIAIRKDELLLFATTTWGRIRETCIGEISQGEKDKYKMIILMWNITQQNKEMYSVQNNNSLDFDYRTEITKNYDKGEQVK